MRIVSLEPYITDLALFFGKGEDLVGVTHRCQFDKPEIQPLVLTAPRAVRSTQHYFNPILSRDAIDVQLLRQVSPDVIVATLVSQLPSNEISREEILTIQQELAKLINKEIKLLDYNPLRLDQIFEDSDRLARELRVTDRGSSIGRLAKAQLMDWGANFYDRMKNKKVVLIANIEPLFLGGLWIPDMIHALSAISMIKPGAINHLKVTWQDIVEFKPDVLVVAPEGYDLKKSMATFKELEKLPNWEELPAVKRGEVVFCDGVTHFYNPGPKIIDSFAIMVSAIAGFESGYITKRDSFYRLRWLELQRHRI